MRRSPAVIADTVLRLDKWNISILLAFVLLPTLLVANLTSSRNRMIHQDTPDVHGKAEKGDEFGWSVATGDFNSDGFIDVAVGSPGEEVRGHVSAGMVNIFYGSIDGVTIDGNQIWHKMSEGLVNTPTSDFYTPEANTFGLAISTGDYNGDGYADIAVGSPGSQWEYMWSGAATDGEWSYDGSVNVLYGSPSGVTSNGSTYIDWQSTGIEIPKRNDGWSAEPGHMGEALASGDFNGDGYEDLAIGAPPYLLHEYDEARHWYEVGSVHVVYGTAVGLDSNQSQIWHQDSDGIPFGIEMYEQFGEAVSSGDFDGDGYDDLVVGVPDEDFAGGGGGKGIVHVLYGTDSGLSQARNQVFHQDSLGVGGKAEVGDRFGSALAAQDFNCDGFDDVAVGSPGEDLSGAGSAGMVSVIYGSSLGLKSDETAAQNSQTWHQDSEGVSGRPEGGDAFGASLASGDFNNDSCADLAIGVPGEVINTGKGTLLLGKEDHGMVSVLYGSYEEGLVAIGAQNWHQDRHNIAGGAESWDEFGHSIATGDIDGNGLDDLVIGVPGEDIDGYRIWQNGSDGAVNVLYSLPGNRVPVADAGEDQAVFVHHDCKSVVLLDGAGSYDLDGHELTYAWQWDAESTTGGSPPVILPMGSHEITLVVSDDTSESLPDTVAIEIDDVVPLISCPPDIVAEATGPVGTSVVLGTPSVEGGECAGVSVYPDDSGLFPLGVTEVNWLAKNNDEMLDPASGNYVHLEAGCVQTLTIVDTTAPTVTAPPAAQVSAPAYGPTAYIGTATAADAVGVVDIYNDAPYVYQQGPTTVTWYAVDEAGNVGSDSQVVVGKKRGGGAASPLWLVLLFSVIGVRNYYSRR